MHFQPETPWCDFVPRMAPRAVGIISGPWLPEWSSGPLTGHTATSRAEACSSRRARFAGGGCVTRVGSLCCLSLFPAAEAPFALMPSPYEYWLEKRAGQVKELVPSTQQRGIDA